MCNRFVQQGREVRPGQRATVVMRGPGGDWEMAYDGAIFGGPARRESRNYWLSRERAADQGSGMGREDSGPALPLQ